VTVLDIDEKITHFYAAIGLELKRKGKPIPADGLWIATLCRPHALPLVSRGRHFDVVADIRRMDLRLALVGGRVRSGASMARPTTNYQILGDQFLRGGFHWAEQLSPGQPAPNKLSGVEGRARGQTEPERFSTRLVYSTCLRGQR
jgi:hypothetical protein